MPRLVFAAAFALSALLAGVCGSPISRQELPLTEPATPRISGLLDILDEGLAFNLINENLDANDIHSLMLTSKQHHKFIQKEELHFQSLLRRKVQVALRARPDLLPLVPSMSESELKTLLTTNKTCLSTIGQSDVVFRPVQHMPNVVHQRTETYIHFSIKHIPLPSSSNQVGNFNHTLPIPFLIIIIGGPTARVVKLQLLFSVGFDGVSRIHSRLSTGDHLKSSFVLKESAEGASFVFSLLPFGHELVYALDEIVPEKDPFAPRIQRSYKITGYDSNRLLDIQSISMPLKRRHLLFDHIAVFSPRKALSRVSSYPTLKRMATDMDLFDPVDQGDFLSCAGKDQDQEPYIRSLPSFKI